MPVISKRIPTWEKRALEASSMGAATSFLYLARTLRIGAGRRRIVGAGMVREEARACNVSEITQGRPPCFHIRETKNAGAAFADFRLKHRAKARASAGGMPAPAHT